MTAADQVFKALLVSIKDETDVEPQGIEQVYNEVTTLRFTVERSIGLLTRLVKSPINGSFTPMMGDQLLKNGIPLGVVSGQVQEQALKLAYDELLTKAQSGELPVATDDAAYQRWSTRFWQLDICPTCSGQPVGLCKCCSGDQTVKCTNCYGTTRVGCDCNNGRVQCTLCHGTGSCTENSWEYVRFEIRQHNAPPLFESRQVPTTKSVSCGWCEMGWTNCTRCSGSGTLNCQASVCFSGRTLCAECRGSGEAPPCKRCDGTGSMGWLHEGEVHLDWGKGQIRLPTTLSADERKVQRALGSDAGLLRESKTTVKSVTPRNDVQSPHSLLVTQDARLKIIRVDAEFAGKTYQVTGYGDKPTLADDSGLQSFLAAPIRKERAVVAEKTDLAHTINAKALMRAINSLAESYKKPHASADELCLSLKTSMQSVYFKEEVSRLLSEPIKVTNYRDGKRVSGNDHHKFITSFMGSIERVFLSLRKQYVVAALVFMALVVGMVAWFVGPFVAGLTGLVMVSASLHNRIFRTRLLNRYQGVFEAPEKILSSFMLLLGSEAIFFSYAQTHREIYAAPGPKIRMWGLLLLIAMGLTSLVAKQGVNGAMLQLKAWSQAALHWLA